MFYQSRSFLLRMRNISD